MNQNKLNNNDNPFPHRFEFLMPDKKKENEIGLVFILSVRNEKEGLLSLRQKFASVIFSMNERITDLESKEKLKNNKSS